MEQVELIGTLSFNSENNSYPVGAPDYYKSVPIRCDHCHQDSLTSMCYLLRFKKSGVYKSISRVCAHDYLKHSEVTSLNKTLLKLLKSDIEHGKSRNHPHLIGMGVSLIGVVTREQEVNSKGRTYYAYTVLSQGNLIAWLSHRKTKLLGKVVSLSGTVSKNSLFRNMPTTDLKFNPKIKVLGNSFW